MEPKSTARLGYIVCTEPSNVHFFPTSGGEIIRWRKLGRTGQHHDGVFQQNSIGKSREEHKRVETTTRDEEKTRRKEEKHLSESAELNRAITRFKEITTSIASKYSEQSTV